jgi:thioesterase domain-containing protein
VDAARDLEQTLHRGIPLTQAMGIRVVRYDGNGLVLAAPLAPNINMLDTAFAGSLYSVLALSGWGWLHLKLAELQVAASFVLHRSSIIYHYPVTEDFEVSCECPEQTAFRHFLDILKIKGRSRLTLYSRVMAQGRIAVTFEGSYVVYS